MIILLGFFKLKTHSSSSLEDSLVSEEGKVGESVILHSLQITNWFSIVADKVHNFMYKLTIREMSALI